MKNAKEVTQAGILVSRHKIEKNVEKWEHISPTTYRIKQAFCCTNVCCLRYESLAFNILLWGDKRQYGAPLTRKDLLDELKITFLRIF